MLLIHLMSGILSRCVSLWYQSFAFPRQLRCNARSRCGSPLFRFPFGHSPIIRLYKQIAESNDVNAHSYLWVVQSSPLRGSYLLIKPCVHLPYIVKWNRKRYKSKVEGRVWSNDHTAIRQLLTIEGTTINASPIIYTLFTWWCSFWLGVDHQAQDLSKARNFLFHRYLGWFLVDKEKSIMRHVEHGD